MGTEERKGLGQSPVLSPGFGGPDTLPVLNLRHRQEYGPAQHKGTHQFGKRQYLYLLVPITRLTPL